MFPSRYTNLAAARKRFGDRVDRLGPYLTRVDPLADEASASLRSLPGDLRKALIARAGSGNLDEAPAPLRALEAQASRVPAWVDWDLVDRGGRLLLRAGPLGGIVLAFKALMLAYASPGGNKPLMLSGLLTEQAARRLAETAQFVRATIAPRGLRLGAPGFRFTLRVRLIHAGVRSAILQGDRWDEGAWGAPINQHDQAGTLLLFSVAVLEGLRQLGMHFTQAEVEAYMHMWRWSGWVNGIDPELLPATEAEGLRLLELIAATQGPPDDDSRALARALLTSGHGTEGGGKGSPSAERSIGAGAAICRALVGDALADSLGVPRTPWRAVLPLVRRLVSSAEFVRQSVPYVDGSVVRAGSRYWDRVVGRQAA